MMDFTVALKHSMHMLFGARIPEGLAIFTIEGKQGEAACYAVNIEDECVEQLRTMFDMPFAEGANTAIMSDAHYSAGCTIDKAPGSYKPIDDIIDPIAESIDINRRHASVLQLQGIVIEKCFVLYIAEAQAMGPDSFG